MKATARARPAILVSAVPTSGDGVDPDLSALISDLATRCSQAIEDAGGRAVLFDLDNARSIDRAVEESDGVLLLGGGDVDPIVYGDTSRHPALYNVDLRTDVIDVALARATRAQSRPLLALCRGMHVANVARGGTLIQDLAESAVAHRGTRATPMVDHDVRLREGSVLSGLLQLSRLRVRSGHHQAVDRLGEGLRAVGWAPDGVVEALESDDGRMLGVQWHPEDAEANPSHRRALFGWLVALAAEER